MDFSEPRRFTTLLETSQALSNAAQLRSGLQHVLEILERHHAVVRGAVTLLGERSEEIAVEAAHGIAAEEARTRASRVLATGRPIVETVDDARDKRTTFVAIPIVLDRRTVGALTLDVRHRDDADVQRTNQFMKVVASMIGQALLVHRLVESEHTRLLEENQSLRRELKERYEFANIVGNSGPMRQVFEQIAQVAQGSTTVLVRGESGTGKELIAHAIHYNSARAQRPYVRVSCAALPETLVESELFGHEKGAFTGAHARKKGRFELAHGGTLFLDEIGELSVSTQVKLLRVLQEREFERLGGTESLRTNVRLIAATNRDIEKAIAKGTFREELYYRLNVFSVFVPPLRDRKPDVMPLADHFLAKYAREHKKKIKRISTPAIDMLVSYHWPGNVRELENAIERAVVVCDTAVLHAHHLPPTLQTAEASGTTPNQSLDEATAAFERDLIQDALKTTRGNRAKSARLLGTTERILRYKVKKYAIDCGRYR